MDDEEAMVTAGGGLKLKSSVVVKEKKSKKDKKKDKKKEKKKRDRPDEPVVAALIPVAQPVMTAAEAKFLEKRRKQEEARLDKASSKSHREKVAGETQEKGMVLALLTKREKEFNAALARLSEHHDIPKG